MGEPTTGAAPVVSRHPGPPRAGHVVTCLAGILTVVLSAALGACSGDSSSRPATTTTTIETTTTAGLPAGATASGLRDLEPGQCFDLPKGDVDAADRAVWLVTCSDPHTHEVADVVTYAGPAVKGGSYPGTAVVQDWAEQACYERFEPFVGRPWTTSSFEIQTWWPSEESWGRSDRKVICTVFPSDGSHTTGTARGTAR